MRAAVVAAQLDPLDVPVASGRAARGQRAQQQGCKALPRAQVRARAMGASGRRIVMDVLLCTAPGAVNFSVLCNGASRYGRPRIFL